MAAFEVGQEPAVEGCAEPGDQFGVDGVFIRGLSHSLGHCGFELCPGLDEVYIQVNVADAPVGVSVKCFVDGSIDLAFGFFHLRFGGQSLVGLHNKCIEEKTCQAASKAVNGGLGHEPV